MQRSNIKELADNYTGEIEVFYSSIEYFQKTNKYLGNYFFIKKFLEKFINTKEYMSILDYGTGIADLPRFLDKWLNKIKIPHKIFGVDNNTTVIQRARDMSKDYENIKLFHKTNIENLTGRYDIIILSQMFHHLEKAEASNLLRNLYKITNKRIIISDFIRSKLSYWIIKTIVYITTTNYINRVDGPISILRAYSDKEIKEILNNAEIKKYKIYNIFPRKFIIIDK